MTFPRSAVMALLLLSTVAARANNFRVADTVYLPAAGKISIFNTDVFLSNPNAERVSVSVAFGPSDAANNASIVAESRTIAVLEPGERRAILNPMTIFGLTEGFGHLIFFGCREGAPNCDCATTPADCRGISVESRIYATSTFCVNNAASCTTGQLFSGLPWYAYAGRNSPSGYEKVFIAGVRQFGDRGVRGFRTNIGLLNASQFSSTELRLTLYSAQSVQLAPPATISLGPLGHTHRNLSFLFENLPVLENYSYITIEQLSVTPTADAASKGCADGCPGFFAYGALLDNLTDDSLTLEAQFFGSMTDAQLGCVFGARTPSRPVRR